MKKRNIISLLTGTALLFSMPMCANLDGTVHDSVPADSFGYTDSKISVLVGTIYKTLKNYPADGNFTALDVMSRSDAATPTRRGGDWYGGGQYREIYMHIWISQTSVIKGAWFTVSEAIGIYNVNLKVMESSDFLSDEQMPLYTSEIRGIRAFWAYKTMDDWGNIPLVTDYADKELLVCQPYQVVFDWLIKEVTEIAETCPGRGNGYAKFTRGIAYTLSAKLYLNVEAWGISCNNAYQMAAERCDKVMAMGYILESDFKANFSLTNESSREAILAVPPPEMDTDKDNRWQLMNRTLHYKDQLALFNGVSAWNGVYAQLEYVKLFPGDDPRKEATFLISQMYNASTGEPTETDHGFLLNHTIDVTTLAGMEHDGTTWGAVDQHNGARYQKWPYSTTLTDAMGNGLHVSRYVDVLLMKTEALLCSGGSASEATSLANQVRERAFGDSNHNYVTATLDDILLERRPELSWETHNRQDDIRSGAYDKGMWAASNRARKADDYLKLLPTSQDAYQFNDKLAQNSGYPAFK